MLVPVALLWMGSAGLWLWALTAHAGTFPKREIVACILLWPGVLIVLYVLLMCLTIGRIINHYR